ncbi:hypothetical protein Tco_0490306, partial [Tanacetum coccineum]
MLEFDTYMSSFSQEVEVFPEIMLNISGDQPSSVRLTSYPALNTNAGLKVRLTYVRAKVSYCHSCWKRVDSFKKRALYVDELENLLDDFMLSLNTEIDEGSIEEPVLTCIGRAELEGKWPINVDHPFIVVIPISQLTLSMLSPIVTEFGVRFIRDEDILQLKLNEYSTSLVTHNLFQETLYRPYVLKESRDYVYNHLLYVLPPSAPMPGGKVFQLKDDITSRNNLPVIVGGKNYYIQLLAVRRMLQPG